MLLAFLTFYVREYPFAAFGVLLRCDAMLKGGSYYCEEVVHAEDAAHAV